MSELTLPGLAAARDRVVPPAGFTVRLTVAVAAAMAYLAVFALALALAADRLGQRWDAALAQTATIRISAPDGQAAAQAEATLRILAETPGIASARRLTEQDQAALLAPWFGADLPVDVLTLPELIEVTADPEGFDARGLTLRLQAEAPGAVLDDHRRWRQPLIAAAASMRALALTCLILIAAAMAGMVTLAAQSALAANLPLIRTLRLIGATDGFIARAFVRRFALRALMGAAAGTVLGAATLALLPAPQVQGDFLGSIAPQGPGWLITLAIPPVAMLVAYLATRLAAWALLRKMT